MSAGDTSLKVPKSHIVVEVALNQGAPRELRLFLPQHPAGSLTTRLLALIDDDRRFIPAFALAEDAYQFINKRAIMWIGFTRSLDDDIELFDQFHWVELELADGTKLSGEVLHSAPAGERRTVDFLNTPTLHVALYRRDRIYLIAKDFVLSVRELDGESDA